MWGGTTVYFGNEIDFRIVPFNTAIEHRPILRQARAAGSSLPSWLLPHAEQNKRFKSFVRLTRNVPMMSPTQLPADSQITDRSSRRRPASRRFRRYLVAICVGVAGTLAWQSYGEATKQIIAKGAPELGWSPEAKQMIATSIQWLGRYGELMTKAEMDAGAAARGGAP